MKISVSVLHTDEIINLEVESYNTIKDIKANFLEEVLIPNDRGLQFEGIRLENNRTVSSYNIKDGSKLDYYGHVSDRLLGGTHIFVKKGKHSVNRYAAHKPVVRVLVKASDKVEDVLARFLKQRGGSFQIEEHQLIYGGEELENSRTLADYNITNGSLVHWVRFRGRLSIFVSVYGLRTITLSAEVTDTIANIKAMMHTIEGIPTEQMSFTCGGMFLLDSDTLFDRDIENHRSFHLSIKLGCPHPRRDGNAVDFVGKVKRGYGVPADETEKANTAEDSASKKEDVKNQEQGEEKKKEDGSKKDDEEITEEDGENKREALDDKKEDKDNKKEDKENKKEDVEIKKGGGQEKDKKEGEKDEPPTRKRKADSQEDESNTPDQQGPQQCVIS